ncbi:MAG: hypothetical protein ACFWUN_07245 [Pseudolactococcus raffinolactis]|jgi:hypothetical protein
MHLPSLTAFTTAVSLYHLINYFYLDLDEEELVTAAS